MSSKTRIWVFHMKELIYTAIFVVLGIVLLLLLIFMFSEDHSERTLTDLSGKYTAGIYTASMTLGGSPVEIAVTVDRDYISSITFHQLDETVAAMYPLMEPALHDLSAQICEKQSAGGCLLFRRQPVYLHDAHEYHPHCSGKSRKIKEATPGSLIFGNGLLFQARQAQHLP